MLGSSPVRRSSRGKRGKAATRKDRYCPRLELLEDRLAPALDLHLSTLATTGVTLTSSGGLATFAATGTGANLNVGDVVGQLVAGNNVAISSGSGGSEAGNIAIDAAINYGGTALRSLTIQSGTGAGVVGNIDVRAPIAATTGLNLELDALNNLSINADLDAAAGLIALQADVHANGSGDDGHGTLSLFANRSVSTKGTLVLRGAAFDMAPGASLSAGVTLEVHGSLPTLSLNIGGSAGANINLSDAELGRLHVGAGGRLAIGDALQTGNITLTTVNISGAGSAALSVVQSTSGGGSIVLADEGTQAALQGNTGSISLTAGSGGILAVAGGDNVPEIATFGALVNLSTPGGVGTAANPLEIATNLSIDQQVVNVGVAARPSAVFLSGLGTLTIGNVSATGNVSITTGGNLNLVGTLATAGAATFNLGGLAGAAATLTATLTSSFGVNANVNVSINGRAGASDTLQGANLDTTFSLSGDGLGTFADINIKSAVHFSSMDSLLGGAGADLFVLANASASLSSLLDGGAGLDVLNVGRLAASFNITGPSDSGFTGTVAGISFTNIESPGSLVFGVSQATGQVLQSLFDLAGNVLGSLTTTAPGIFSKVVAEPFGGNGQTIVFGLGGHGQIYESVLDGRGTLRFGWSLVAPGAFTDLAVTSYGTGVAPIVFGLGVDHQVYGAALTTAGSLAFGWFPVGSGRFASIAATNFGAGLTNPIVFGIGAQDSQIYAARLNAGAVVTSPFAVVAPGSFLEVTAASRPDGSLEVFALGSDHQVYGAQLNAAGNLSFGWFLTAPGLFSHIVAGAGAGGLSGLGLGNVLNLQDSRPFFASVFNAAGTLNQGWINLTKGLFSTLSTGAGQITLFGLGSVGTDDLTDNINQGFLQLTPGPFTSLGTSGAVSVAGNFQKPAAAKDALLTLTLKPLDIHLLGLQVQSSPITATVTPEQGNGKLLGNLLRTVSSVVNVDEINKALNNVLGATVDLLNSIDLQVAGVGSGQFSNAAASTTSVLDLFVAPVHLNLLGARVDTSPIHLTITARSGQGLVLGNILTALSDLLNPPLPSRLDLDFINTRLKQLLDAVNQQIPNIPGATVPPPSLAEGQILSLTVPAIDVNLLGLVLQTAPITVNATAQTGNGALLGNVLTTLLKTLHATPAQLSTLNGTLNNVLAKVIGVLNVSTLTLPAGALNKLSQALQTLALPNLIAPANGATAPILDLIIASSDGTTPPVDLNLLGLQVTTSNIDAHLSAKTGQGQVLGNLLFNLANLLNPGGPASLLKLITDLATGSHNATGFPAPTSSTPSDIPATPLLTLNLPPLNLDLLGLRVQSNTITARISAKQGNGKLLGNVLTGISTLINPQGVSKALNNVLATTVGLLNSVHLQVAGVGSGAFSTGSASTTPVLDLLVAPVHLDLLGVLVDTDPIHLTITAQSGDGLVLGNVVAALANLFNPPLPDSLDLAFINSRLEQLLVDLNKQIPGIPAATVPPPTLKDGQILSLTVPAIDLHLLGLVLQTTSITVNATAKTGDGLLLGNILTTLLNTLNATPQELSRLSADLSNLLAKVVGVLNAATLTLPTDILNSLSSVLQTLALPDLIAPAKGASTPILDLAIQSTDGTSPPVSVDLLGLLVTTSDINAHLSAQTGQGLILGNLLFNVANLLNPNETAVLLFLLAQLGQ